MNNVFKYSIPDGFLWSEVNLKGERQYYIEGYASTIDKDKAGEILDVEAQQDIFNQIQNENITMDIEHEEWYDEQGQILPRPKNEKIPVAKIIGAELRPQGVWVKAQLNTNLRSFNELWGSIKQGFLKAFSVAFYPIQKANGIVKHLNLVNVTLTGSPVNPNATFAVSMKSAAAWLDTQEAVTKSEDKMGEEKEYKCKECDKEFESQEALDEHKKSHEEKESKVEEKEEKEPETKCNTEEQPKVKAEEPVIDVQAEIKAMKEAHEAEMKALREDNAKLKAELEKPVMKAGIERVMPVEKNEIKIVSPLQLVR